MKAKGKYRRVPTRRMLAVRDWIVAFHARTGQWPTQGEIADGCGYLHSASVRPMLQRLRAYGLVTRDSATKKSRRNVRVTP
jgi:DNA-binding IclR family transcriptional regulator